MSTTPTSKSKSAARARVTLLLSALLTSLALIGIAASATAQVKRHPRHGRLANMLPEMQDSVTLVEVQPQAKARRASVARNARRTYEAYLLEVPLNNESNNLHEVIFIEDKRSGKIYEVRGFDFPRPFTDLVWRGDNTLVFDQWMQPHYAVHYEINVAQGKLVVAATFWERGYKP